MIDISAERIDELLDRFSSDEFDYGILFESFEQQHPEIILYLSGEEILFLTEDERAYFDFIVNFLWFVAVEEHVDPRQVGSNQLQDREEAIWGLVNDNFSMEHIMTSLDLNVNIGELILEALDDETFGKISASGKEWIFVKVMTIVSLIFES